MGGIADSSAAVREREVAPSGLTPVPDMYDGIPDENVDWNQKIAEQETESAQLCTADASHRLGRRSSAVGSSRPALTIDSLLLHLPHHLTSSR